MKAFVSGANSLVNKVLLARLVQMNYQVVAHYHSDNELTQEIKRSFAEVNFIKGDFSSEAEFGKVYPQIEKGGPYDVFVNAAVTYGAFENEYVEKEKSWQTWEKVFGVNAIAPALFLTNAEKLINKGGVVINISSTMGQKQFGVKEFAMYCASKSALDSLTGTYAKRFAPNIRVVGIAPGYILSSWNVNMSKQELEVVVKDNLTQKLVTPEEVADVMEMVIKNPSMTATTVLIDGGYSHPVI